MSHITKNVNTQSSNFSDPVEEYKFSLSDVGEQYAPVGNYSTPFNELALGDDVDHVDDKVQTTETAPEAPFRNEIDPIAEEEANAIKDEKVNAHSKTSLDSIQTELANVKELRSEAYASFEKKVAQKQAELNLSIVVG